MKTIEKIVLAILFFMSYITIGVSQNLDSIPQPERDSLLISRAKEVVLKYGPGYYREYKEPIISRVERIPPKGVIIPEWTVLYRFYYEVTYLYDKEKEKLSEKFAARVSFTAINGEPVSILFGNGMGILIPEDNNLRSNKEIEQIPYEQAIDNKMILDEIFIPDE